MKLLKELVKIVHINRIRKVEIMDSVTMSSSDSLLGKLYNGISKGQFNNDLMAEKVLYNKKNSNGYKDLKSDLKQRLLNNLFFIDLQDSKYSKYARNRMLLAKQMALSTMLATMGAQFAATQLAKQVLHKAQKFTFNNIVIDAIRLLKGYASYKGDIKGLEHYQVLLKKHLKMLEADILAEEYFEKINIRFDFLKTPRKAIVKESAAMLQELWPLYHKYQSYSLNYFTLRLCAIHYLADENYTEALDVFDQTEKFIQSNPYYHRKNLIASINLFKIGCYVQLQDFEAGENCAKVCLAHYRKGKNNWFIFNDVYFLFAIRTKKYLKCHEIFNEVVFHHNFQRLSEERQERWKIYEAYLNFIKEMGLVEMLDLERFRQKRFRIEKFLNEVPFTSKDKRGYNISILVIHILFLLVRKEYSRIFDRTDALKVYLHKYLKNEEDQRSKILLQMLLKMEKQHFDLTKTMQKTAPLYKKLQQTPYHFQGTTSDAEIIPYETLWEMVLDILRKQEARD